MRILAFAALFLAFFSGCSEKKYFTPQESQITGEMLIHEVLESPIARVNNGGAVLENGTIIAKNGEFYPLNLAENLTLLSAKNGVLLVSDYQNSALVRLNSDGKELQRFSFDFPPISAALQGDLLAVVLADNTSLLWDTRTNEKLFSHKGATTMSINANAAECVFWGSSVVFPLLDGKLLIVSTESLKATRTISLGGGGFLNNIIYLALEGETLIAATNNRVLSLVGGRDFSYDVSVRDILQRGGRIYVLSLEGEVIELDFLLNELRKKKFPFASLNALVVGESVYALETQGYVLRVDLHTFNEEIYALALAGEPVCEEGACRPSAKKRIKIGQKDSLNANGIIYYDEFVIKPQNAESTIKAVR